jgi:hypothetical protein
MSSPSSRRQSVGLNPFALDKLSDKNDSSGPRSQACGGNFAAHIRKQYDEYGRVIRDANIKSGFQPL